jgi:hypothetical protein
MMKKLFFLLVLAAPLLVVAQDVSELKFVEEIHDFGLIKESDGPAEYKFEFTNVTQEPITITNVRASCGCTTPSWTKTPVMPGESGQVTAVYNPKNRPGPFNKTLTVTTTGKRGNILLRIQGKVEPKPRTIEDDFPTVMGGLRTKYRAFNMGKVYNNKPTSKEFEVYNQSEKEITFLDRIESPEHIKVTFSPKTIGPAQKGKVVITYDGASKNDLGFISDAIVLYTNEAAAEAKKNFTVYADINEYFGPISAESAAMAPKLTIEERIFDFGTLEQGATKEATFALKNTGKSPLNIRKTMANCSCTIVALDRYDIQPNETAQMIVRFNTTGRRGTQQKSITIYSNDPASPVQRVVLKAVISVPNN